MDKKIDMRKKFPIGTYIGNYYKNDKDIILTISKVTSFKTDSQALAKDIVYTTPLARKKENKWSNDSFNPGEFALWNFNVCNKDSKKVVDQTYGTGCTFKISKKSKIFKEFTDFVNNI